MLRLDSPPEHVFPRLTSAQMERVAAHGRRRGVKSGEVLLEMGESGRIFVITAGSVETVRVVADVEEIIVTHGVGSFTGEVAILSGQRGLARNRAREAGEVIEVDRTQLVALVQTDSELSDRANVNNPQLHSSELRRNNSTLYPVKFWCVFVPGRRAGSWAAR